MSFPKTRQELVEKGYVYSNMGICRGCGVAVDWWTTPNGRATILDPVGAAPDAEVISHFVTCPERNRFRKAGGDGGRGE